MKAIQGIHHITAVASDPQRNVDFYHKVLGQRLVKKTVNFDDPGTYHFYYGDKVGSPGTILTFFPWQYLPQGKRGNGEVGSISYSIPKGASSYWLNRLSDLQISHGEYSGHFNDQGVSLADPDGMTIHLIETSQHSEVSYWEEGPIPKEFALNGFYSVTMNVSSIDGMIPLLEKNLSYQHVKTENNQQRFIASNEQGMYLDLVVDPSLSPAQFGAGSIHHIAFRVDNDEEQVAYMERLRENGYWPTTVKDRCYFLSIYFRTPGGILFELATDEPGFVTDETVTELGQGLQLPYWLEQHREDIADRLPTLSLDNLKTKEASHA